MKPAKLSFFSNIVLISITTILMICALSLTWMGADYKMEVSPLSFSMKTEITLTKMKVKGEIPIFGKIDMENKLKEACDTDSKNTACKLSRASIALITLSTFGMVCIIAAGVIIILNLCCKMSEKSPKAFKFIYMGTVIAGFVLFVVSFIEYTIVAKDFKGDMKGNMEEEGIDLKYKGGWIIYLVGTILSLIILIIGASNLCFKD